MKKEILNQFKTWLQSEVQAGNQTQTEAQTNYKDLARMGENRLIKMKQLFSI